MEWQENFRTKRSSKVCDNPQVVYQLCEAFSQVSSYMGCSFLRFEGKIEGFIPHRRYFPLTCALPSSRICHGY